MRDSIGPLMRRLLLAFAAAGCLPVAAARGQDTPGLPRALIVCGLSGDEVRHKAFVDTIGRLRDGLTTSLQVSAADIDILFGDEPGDDDPDWLRSTERATREQVEQRSRALCDRAQPGDSAWVFVLGHSHYDGQQSWFNLPGPDLNQMEFVKLFASLKARQQTFVIATPTSGFAIKPLSAKGRVILTATEADWETNETEYPHEFARLLSNLDTEENLDVDRDGRISLFDLHVATARNLAQSFAERELLATEHALLDDDGNGRGTEVQIDFLTIDQGGRLQPNRPFTPPVIATGDGVLSKSIVIRPAK